MKEYKISKQRPKYMTCKRQLQRHLGKTNTSFCNWRQFEPSLLVANGILIQTLIDGISHAKDEKKIQYLILSNAIKS